MKVLIDSSAWIEYLGGSKLGLKVRELILGDHEIYTLNLIVSEVISKVKRSGLDVEIAYNSLITNSTVIEFNPMLSKEAGLLHAETRKNVKNFGLIDSIILVASRNLNAKVLTKDTHLKNFKESISI